jgi:hypothetical protein
LDFGFFREGKVPVPITKQKIVEILIKCFLVIMTLVVVFGKKTFAERAADDEVLI